MKTWVVRVGCVLLALGAALQLFYVKYQVIDREHELKRIHRQIADDMREIHIWEAEWALLNNPDRLRKLVANYTTFQPIGAKQIVRISDLPMRAAPVPESRPVFVEDAEGQP